MDDCDHRYEGYRNRELAKLEGFRSLIDELGLVKRPSLTEALREHLRQGFDRVEATPRDDPFWSGTNELTTTPRVRHFHASRLAQDANALEAAWVVFAIDFLQMSRELVRARLWPMLAARRELVPRWVVESEWAAWVSSGGWSDPEPLLLAGTVHLGIADEVREILRRLTESPNGAVFGWAGTQLAI